MNNIVKILSNYGSRLWSLVSVFIFIPFYIKFLGVENYAIISFYSLLLGIIGFVDSGISSAVMKEFASDNNVNYKYSILKQAEKIYIYACLGICTILLGLSDFISEFWLTTNSINSSYISFNVKLISIGVGLQLISSMYYGALFGLGYQVRANIYQVIWSISKTALIVLYFYFFTSSLKSFFIWQIICNFLYILLLRIDLIRELKKITNTLVVVFKKLPSNILNYIISVTLLAVITSLNSYSDKLIVSSVFSLEVFGFYNIASIVSQSPVLFTSPLVLFIFPIFAKFYSQKELDRLKKCFDRIFILVAIIVLPLTLIIMIYSTELLELWTRNTLSKDNLQEIGGLVVFLVVGFFFAALQIPINSLFLAIGKTKYTLIVSVFQLFIGGILLYVCSLSYGLNGLSKVWIFINLISFCLLYFFMQRKVFQTNTLRMLQMMLLLFIVSSISLFAIFSLYIYFEQRYVLVFVIFSSVVSCFLNIVTISLFKNEAVKKIISFSI